MQTELPPLTSTVARFASSTRYADIPADVVRLSKSAMLDCLAVAFAGCVAEGSVLLRRHLAQFGFPRPNASVIGSDLRLPAQFAALVWIDLSHTALRRGIPWIDRRPRSSSVATIRLLIAPVISRLAARLAIVTSTRPLGHDLEARTVRFATVE